MKSSYIGLALVIGFTLLAISFSSDIRVFVNVPGLLIIIFVTLGITLISHDLKAAGQAIAALILPYRSKQLIDSGIAPVLNTIARSAYVSASVGAIIGIIQILSNLEDLTRIGPALALLILSFLYGIIIAEFIARPALRRLETMK